MELADARMQNEGDKYHSLQKRKVICSIFFFCSSPVLDAGDAIVALVGQS
jgi:hypothetical protein